MSNGTPKLRVRFHGRFVFVNRKKELIVLAVNMDEDTPRDKKGNLHDVFMTVRERQVDRKSPPPGGEQSPTYRTFGGNVVPTAIGAKVPPDQIIRVPYDGSHLMWNIDGCEIDITATGGFSWTADPNYELADLTMLSEGETLDKRYLPPFASNDVTRAIIRVRAGEGTAYHELPEEPAPPKSMDYKFVRGSETLQEGTIFHLADMVEVVAELPDSAAILFGPEGPNARPGVTVKKRDLTLDPKIQFAISTDVVLDFSNLCTSSQEGRDLEFSEFYNVLTNPPLKKMRWVPQSTVQTIRPWGDCYLGAQVTSAD